MNMNCYRFVLKSDNEDLHTHMTHATQIICIVKKLGDF